ncbi:MAG: type II secretion system protein [Candidatus Komeilibacteria bacterium]|jgi:prepilin-type N-terminal cleavage/methylation domain-containing protein|nr:type II secretion system protein [Candidatus Komeilibacteria bacterium]MBT4447944.1 type II secretion system protein [Candidatus Komeilibacteria bacterium]
MKIETKGFTLVELLVVIAIIGILSTVAVVNLNSARDKAKIATLEHTMASILPAINICHNSSSVIRNGSGLAGNSGNCESPPPYPPSGNFNPGGELCLDPLIDWPELSEGAIQGLCYYFSGAFHYRAFVAGAEVRCDTSTGCTTL